MKINTLVKHKKLPNLGIGCVSRVLSKSAKVDFGTEDVKTCKIEQLEVIDVSECKTVDFHEFRTRILSDNSTLNYIIIGNELKHYVGIGWVTVRVVTMEDLKNYPRVV